MIEQINKLKKCITTIPHYIIIIENRFPQNMFNVELFVIYYSYKILINEKSFFVCYTL